MSYVAANGLIAELCKIGLLTEVTGGSRNRIFRFGPYLDLFNDIQESPSEITDAQATLH